MFPDDFLDRILGSSTTVTTATGSPTKSLGSGSSTFPDAECLQDMSIDALADLIEDDSISSAFSGVAAPEVASLLFHDAVQRRLLLMGSQRQLRKPKILGFIEWDRECIEELKLLAAEHDACIHTNIAEFFKPELKEVIEQLRLRPSLALEVLGPIVKAGNAVRGCARCVVHSTGKNMFKMCHLKVAKRHVAGTSCTAHSSQGNQLGALDETILYFLAWCGLRIHLQEADVTQENVSGFPTGPLLVRMLGHLYFIEACDLDPTEFGQLDRTHTR